MLGRVGAQSKLSGDDTSGLSSILEHPVLPRVLMHPHVHTQEDEYSDVRAGTIGARVRDDVYEELGPGSLLCRPRTVPHTFWNPTHKGARLVEIVAPPGLDRFFAELGPLVAGEPDPEAISGLTDRRCLTFPTRRIEDLQNRYGVPLAA